MSDYVGTIASVLSLILGMAIYWFDVRKRFEELLSNQEGILSKAQADDLAHLYLNTVQARLSLALSHYAANDLPGHIERGELDRVMTELERAYDQVVRKSIRPMVTTFRLRGRHRFDEVVSRVSRKRVNDGFLEVRSTLTDSIAAKTPVLQIMPLLERSVKAVNDEGEALILKEIDKLYPRAAAD